MNFVCRKKLLWGTCEPCLSVHFGLHQCETSLFQGYQSLCASQVDQHGNLSLLPPLLAVRQPKILHKAHRVNSLSALQTQLSPRPVQGLDLDGGSRNFALISNQGALGFGIISS